MRRAARAAVLKLTGGVGWILAGPARGLNRAARSPRVPILVYHQIAESGGPDGYPWRVTPTMFEAQMRHLADEGHRVVSLAGFLRARAEGRPLPRAVVLTFDDGFRGVLLHAYPVLKRYGFPATLFLATGSMGDPDFPWIRQWLGRGEDPEEYRPLSWDEVRAIRGPVVDLGSHTVTHPHLGRLAPSAAEWELVESRRQIELETGCRTAHFAYPGGMARYGDHTDATRAMLLETGYTGAAVSEIGRNGPTADPLRLRRLSIGAEDSLGAFRAKVLGAHDWVRALQWAAHRMLPDSSSY
jgi:peptidoglycan/xylan/chitin deacetylase (PgdA/CDA1 family)